MKLKNVGRYKKKIRRKTLSNLLKRFRKFNIINDLKSFKQMLKELWILLFTKLEWIKRVF